LLCVCVPYKWQLASGDLQFFFVGKTKTLQPFHSQVKKSLKDSNSQTY
jgi:hypothetical protein